MERFSSETSHRRTARVLIVILLLVLILWAAMHLIGWAVMRSQRGVAYLVGVTELRGASECFGLTLAGDRCLGYNVWYGE
jgi:hypothetical protein